MESILAAVPSNNPPSSSAQRWCFHANANKWNPDVRNYGTPKMDDSTVLLCHTDISVVFSRMWNGSPLPMAQALSTPTLLRLPFNQRDCRRYIWNSLMKVLHQPVQLEMKFTFPKDEVLKFFISVALERLFQAIGILIEQLVFPSRPFVRRANSIGQASESALRNGSAQSSLMHLPTGHLSVTTLSLFLRLAYL